MQHVRDLGIFAREYNRWLRTYNRENQKLTAHGTALAHDWFLKHWRFTTVCNKRRRPK